MKLGHDLGNADVSFLDANITPKMDFRRVAQCDFVAGSRRGFKLSMVRGVVAVSSDADLSSALRARPPITSRDDVVPRAASCLLALLSFSLAIRCRATAMLREGGLMAKTRRPCSAKLREIVLRICSRIEHREPTSNEGRLSSTVCSTFSSIRSSYSSGIGTFLMCRLMQCRS